MNSIGTKLKEIRKIKKMTQEDLATGITNRSYISQIEKGMVKPSIKLLRKFCDRLDCELSEFFVESEPELLKLDITNQLISLEYSVLHHDTDEEIVESLKIIRDNLEKLNKNDLALFYFCQAKYLKSFKKDWDNAIPDFLKSIELHEGNNKTGTWIRAVNELSEIYIKINENDHAFPLLDHAYHVAITQKIGGVEKIKLLTNLGITHAKIGEYRSAIRFLNEALEISHQTSVFVQAGEAYLVLGLSYKNIGNLALALTAYEKALIHFSSISDRLNSGGTLTNIGIVYRNQKKYDSSIYYLEKAKETFDELEDSYGYLNTEYELAVSHFLNNDYQTVEKLHENFCEKLTDDFPSKINTKFTLLMGDLYVAASRTDLGINLYKQAYLTASSSSFFKQNVISHVLSQLGKSNNKDLVNEWVSFIVEQKPEVYFIY